MPYDIQDQAALRIVAVTGTEADGLDREWTRLAGAVDAAGAAAGGGSPVAAALAEVRGRGEEVARAGRALVDSAAAGARTAIAAYTGADGDMAEVYGPFPVFDPFDALRPAPRFDPLDPSGVVPPR